MGIPISSALYCCKNNKKDEEMEKDSNDDDESERKENPSELINLKDLKSYVNYKNFSSISKSESRGSNIEDSLINSGQNLKKRSNFLLLRNDDEKKKLSPDNLNNADKKVKFNIDSIKSSNHFFSSKALSTVVIKQSFEPIKYLGIYKIQKLYKGFIYRKYLFPEIKKNLELETLNQLKNIYNEFLTENLKKQEELLGIIHNEDSYKNLLLIKEEIDPNSKNYFTTLYKLTYNNLNAFYIGECDIDKNLNGRGILTLSNGIKYNGNFIENIFTGKGNLIDKEGIYYEGNFENSILEGEGKQILLNGCSFEGNFEKGIKTGFGKEECIDHIYEGEYKNDQKNGNGKLYFKLLNETYEGNFIDNNINGNGIYKWNSGEIYTGNFLNGKMNGKGKYTWPDGGFYEGDYINNIKEGNGKFKWANGKIYIGPFKNGNPNGNGILFVNNRYYEVNFENGEIKGKVVEIEGKKKKNKKKYQNNEESSESFYKISSFDNDYERDSNNDISFNLASTKENKVSKKNYFVNDDDTDDDDDDIVKKKKSKKKKTPRKKKDIFESRKKNRKIKNN